MKIIVCGGRDYQNRELVFETMDRVHKHKAITMVVEGGATGADRLAREWALDRCVDVATVHANWKKYNGYAGHKRNGAMLKLSPDGVVAFPGGKGTANMIEQANGAGVKVMEIKG